MIFEILQKQLNCAAITVCNYLLQNNTINDLIHQFLVPVFIYTYTQDLIQKIRAASSYIVQKGHFFEKKSSKNFTPPPSFLPPIQHFFLVFCMKIKLCIIFKSTATSDCRMHKRSRFGPGHHLNKAFFCQINTLINLYMSATAQLEYLVLLGVIRKL